MCAFVLKRHRACVLGPCRSRRGLGPSCTTHAGSVSVISLNTALRRPFAQVVETSLLLCLGPAVGKLSRSHARAERLRAELRAGARVLPGTRGRSSEGSPGTPRSSVICSPPPPSPSNYGPRGVRDHQACAATAAVSRAGAAKPTTDVRDGVDCAAVRQWHGSCASG